MLSQGIPINPKKPGSSQARGMDPMQRHVLAARKNKKNEDSWAIYGILRLYQWEFQDDRYLNHMIIIISLDLKITMLG
jgi:hypothetical protein